METNTNPPEWTETETRWETDYYFAEASDAGHWEMVYGRSAADAFAGFMQSVRLLSGDDCDGSWIAMGGGRTFAVVKTYGIPTPAVALVEWPAPPKPRRGVLRRTEVVEYTADIYPDGSTHVFWDSPDAKPDSNGAPVVVVDAVTLGLDSFTVTNPEPDYTKEG